MHPHNELPDDGLLDALAHFAIKDTIFTADDLNGKRLDELVACLLGTDGVLTGNLVVSPTSSIAFVGVDSFGLLPDTIDGVQEITGSKPGSAGTKFFVVDPGTDTTYRYLRTDSASLWFFRQRIAPFLSPWTDRASR